jgi:magnesium-dependent phosphatase 1
VQLNVVAVKKLTMRLMLLLLTNNILCSGFRSHHPRRIPARRCNSFTTTNKAPQPPPAAATATTPLTAVGAVPSLVVFDLDNTLWTPELYQLRNVERTNRLPVAHVDVRLFPAAKDIIQQIRDGNFPNTKFAIASRTKSVDWAHHLLDQFELREIFDYVEIFPGDKRRHFSNLRDTSGYEYCEMIFFDDNRDGKFGNCEPVSTLGVLSVHCPNGLSDYSIWTNALSHYRDWSSHKTPGTIVEWDNSITIIETTDPNERISGRVKYINREKRFGFIQPSGRQRSDVFFHFSALPVGSDVEEGDEITFITSTDSRRGKVAAGNIELPKKDVDNCVNMRVFSMNMPFAALLSNGYKTIETRNGTMFTPYPEGTRMLLHVGQRTYPDRNRHIDVMKSGGLDEGVIQTLKSLPPGFSKGMAVAIVELGKTYDTTLEQRCDPDFQRAVAAFGIDSGMRATDIKRVEYLKRGVEIPARGGVFKVNIDRDVIPDGWLDSDDDNGPANKKGVFYSATF